MIDHLWQVFLLQFQFLTSHLQLIELQLASSKLEIIVILFPSFVATKIIEEETTACYPLAVSHNLPSFTYQHCLVLAFAFAADTFNFSPSKIDPSYLKFSFHTSFTVDLDPIIHTDWGSSMDFNNTTVVTIDIINSDRHRLDFHRNRSNSFGFH